MIVLAVRAADQVARVDHARVRDHARRVEPHRRGVARDPAGLGHLLRGQRPRLVGAQRVDQLQLVDLEVAPNHGEGRLAVDQEEGGLGGALGRHAEKFGQRLDRRRARRRHFFHRQGVLVGRRAAGEFGPLLIGRVAAGIAERDVVFADLREKDELLGLLSADRSGIRLHRDDGHAAAPIYVVIGLGHRGVGLLKRLLVDIERVGVLHDELAHADQPAAGARLVAELGLHLKHALGQVAVGLGRLAEQIGDRLLVRRREHHRPLAAVAQLE